MREVCDKFYRNAPDGLSGNDDCGQMSAWYVFSAMGFYPFNPCGGEYVIGAPQVPKVALHFSHKEHREHKEELCKRVKEITFTIVTRNLSSENKYVKSVTLNGKPLEGRSGSCPPIIRHADIMRGGELVFEMAPKP